MENILITGVAGNIGASLARRILKENRYNVIGVDNLSTGALKNLPDCTKGFRFEQADVNNYQEIADIFHSVSIDWVFHFAAVVGVQRTLRKPLDVMRDIDGIKNILVLSKNTAVRRVFFSSSSEVYGEPVEIPQNEQSTPLNSRLPYAIVKNVGEAYFKSYHKEHGLDYTIFRFFNTYGPNQSFDFVIPKFIELALSNRPIPLYGSGVQTRTFCYIDDNVDTIFGCFSQNKFVNDTLNIGSDLEISIAELATRITRLCKSSSTREILPSLPEGDMTRRVPDITKMRSVLGRELIELDAGLARTIDFLRR